MGQTVERTSLDLRFQGYRLRNDAAEARLLASIAEHSRASPVRRRAAFVARHEHRRRGRDALAQQGVGEHAPRSALRNEPGRTRDPVSRCVPRLQTRDFHAQANLLVASLLSRRESSFKKMEEFYDRSGHA